MRYREACAQRGLYSVAYDAEHGRDAGDVTGIGVSSPEPLDSICLLYAPFFLSGRAYDGTDRLFVGSGYHTGSVGANRVIEWRCKHPDHFFFNRA